MSQPSRPVPRGLSAIFLTASVILFATGCTSTGSRHRVRTAQGPLSPFLIFDRVPSTVDPAGLTRRPDHRTAEVGYEVYQETEFVEFFIDRQNGHGNFDDDFNRRFTTRRVGRISR